MPESLQVGGLAGEVQLLVQGRPELAHRVVQAHVAQAGHVRRSHRHGYHDAEVHLQQPRHVGVAYLDRNLLGWEGLRRGTVG